MNFPAGYYTASCYVGILPDGTKMYFASEADYYDYIAAALEVDGRHTA